MSHEELDQFPDLPKAETPDSPPKDLDSSSQPESARLWPFELFTVIALSVGTIAAINGVFDRPGRGATLSSQAEKKARLLQIEQAIEEENAAVLTSATQE